MIFLYFQTKTLGDFKKTTLLPCFLLPVLLFLSGGDDVYSKPIP